MLQRVELERGEYGRDRTNGEPVQMVKENLNGSYTVERHSDGKRQEMARGSLDKNYIYDVGDFAEYANSNVIVKVVAITKPPQKPDHRDAEYKVAFPGRTGMTVSNFQLTRRLGVLATPATKAEFEERAQERVPGTRQHQYRGAYVPEELFITESLPKLVFRGDTRPPAEIFKKGFTPRETHVAPLFRIVAPAGGGEGEQFDIEPGSAVCAARVAKAAALFPEEDGPTYVYAVVVEKYVDTAALQRWVGEQMPEHKRHVDSLAFARELASPDGISAQNVLGVVRVVRKWVTPDHVTFEAGDFEENPTNLIWKRASAAKAAASLRAQLDFSDWYRERVTGLPGGDAGAIELQRRLCAERDLLLARLEPPPAPEHLKELRATANATIDAAAQELRDLPGGGDERAALYSDAVKRLTSSVAARHEELVAEPPAAAPAAPEPAVPV